MDNMDMNGFSDDISNESNQSASFWDILNMPVGTAVVELVKKGAKAARDIKQGVSDLFQEMADEEYSKMCRPLISMDECLSWLNIQREIYPQAAYFFIFVEQNPSPRNENDLFSVTIALVDARKKPIPVTAIKQPRRLVHSIISSKNQEQDIVCIVIPAKTLDTKLLKALNGDPSVLIKL